MRFMLDPGHLDKPDRPHDRGAAYADREEVEIVLAYLSSADRWLRALGHEVFVGAGPGAYPERIALASRLGCAVYVQGHVDAGLAGRPGDRGTVIYDHRSKKGASLASFVAVAMGKVTPWPVKAAPSQPDDDGQPRDEDLSEAFGCISAAYALKPVAILLEPGFIDGALGSAWLAEPANVRSVGVALADGIHKWVTHG